MLSAPHVFLIPEYHGTNPFFYAGSSRIVSPTMVKMPGYRLWALTDALDDFSQPMTVVAAKFPGDSAYFHKVAFMQTPDFSLFGLTVSEDSVIYMEGHELAKRKNVMPVINNNWHEYALRYHAIGAYYHLGVIPTISMSLLRDASGFDILENEMKSLYEISTAYHSALHRLFVDALFGLSFFGFTHPETEREKLALEYAEGLAHQTVTPDYNCWFAFGSIRYAIRKYHESCYGNGMQNPCVFTVSSFKALRDSCNLVADILRKMGFPVQEDDFRGSLLRAVKQYQRRKKIDEPKCGRKTLRSLLFDAVSHNQERLAKIAGFSTGRREPPPLATRSDNLNCTGKLGQMIDQMNSMAREQQKLSNVIVETAEMTNSMCEVMRERVDNCESRMAEIAAMISQLAQMNELVESQLDQADTALENVLNQHIHVQERILALKDKINAEKMSNRLLAICGICIIVMFVVRLYWHK